MSIVGVAGLGLMGSAMARRLLAAGHSVTVWNRDPARVGPLVALGASAAASPAALAARCAVLHLSVTDDAAVEAVVLGRDGIAECGRPGGLLVDHSTISVATTLRCATALKDRAGWAWVDAPVSGGSAGAEAGTLACFAGGEAADVTRAGETAGAFARRIAHMGPQGAGAATKLANQLLVGGTFLLLAEALHLARRAGVAAERLPAALEGGFGDSVLLQRQFARMAAGPEATQGTCAVMLKDLDLVLDAARAAGAGLPLAGLARELWRLHVGHGFGAEDWVSIAKLHAPAART